MLGVGSIQAVGLCELNAQDNPLFGYPAIKTFRYAYNTVYILSRGRWPNADLLLGVSHVFTFAMSFAWFSIRSKCIEENNAVILVFVLECV